MRDFRQTPEPEGKKQFMGRGPLRFVIQKHQATRLHYDLRLECEGVLKSWAVPKKITLDPEQKHLAVMVEDHPLDYRTFEGVIPPGNYGAGTVMIWDEGVYGLPEAEDRADAEKILEDGLARGHVTFLLEGKKLRGEFALVKIKGGKENSWLLIKKNDQHARPGDNLEDDRSAATGRTVKEIIETGERLTPRVSWNDLSKIDFADAPAAEIPEEITPMFATLVDEPFNREGWYFEIKLDGYRALARIEEGETHLFSRNKISLDRHFKRIINSFMGFPGQAVFDGEIVALDDSGRSDFQLLQNFMRTGIGNLVYFVFDVPYLNGHDLRKLSLERRKTILRKALPDGLPYIKYSEHVEERGLAMFKFAKENNLEGIVAKNKSSPYQEGMRGKDWLKIKKYMEQEAVIAGYTEPRGGRKHLGSLVLGVYKNNELIPIGHAGGGLKAENLGWLKEKLDEIKTNEVPFKNPLKSNAPVHWVRPELVCQVKFAEWTDEGIMRQPVFLGLREDKNPKQVSREEPQSAEKVMKKKAPKKIKQKVGVGGRELELTSLEKVFWPKEGYTKGDLIDFYRQISPYILPYLKDRPESLNRHPEGIEGFSFFQKDMDHQPPEWVKIAPIWSENESKTVNYLVCQDRATLVYMINLGCIEINPWNSKYFMPDHPDYLVLDLDPLDVPFSRVTEAAKAVRQVLEKAEIKSFCKTSGATGLHVFVPLGAKYTYAQAREFAQLVALIVHSKLPDTTSVERSPTKRAKRVYLDYLQNSKGQTLASAYCVRPRPGATVSTPLEWGEVNLKLDPAKFTIKNIFGRLERKGDIWKGVLGKGPDLEKSLDNLQRAYYRDIRRIININQTRGGEQKWQL